MNAPRPPLACTGARLRRLTRRVTVFYEQYLRTVGLRLTQYSVLAHLELEPQPLQILAEKLEMDRTTLTRGIRPLVAAGWIAQTPGADAR
ncbi:MAG TPA: MarR family transcriptional regulator, partial [Denitromonas sp.]|nr:MarR family transcriptional regulator [Denitromonas sp.]